MLETNKPVEKMDRNELIHTIYELSGENFKLEEALGKVNSVISNKEDDIYLSIINSWMDDSDVSSTAYVEKDGERIFAYYYPETAGFDETINIVAGRTWQEVLERGFIDPIVDYLNNCKKDEYLEQTYFNANELKALKQYVNVDFKTKLSEEISSYREEGEKLLEDVISGRIR